MTIREELLALQERYPLLPRKTIRKWALDHPNSAIYKGLEHDPQKGLEEYQLIQISQMIAIHVVNVEGVREMHSLSIDRPHGGGYRHIDNIMSDASMRDVLLKDAFNDFERFRQKYETLRDLASVFSEMKKVRTRVKKRKGKRRRPGGATLSAAQTAV